jgi:hypothetical protein
MIRTARRKDMGRPAHADVAFANRVKKDGEDPFGTIKPSDLHKETRGILLGRTRSGCLLDYKLN